ncbi:MFS transporter, partial [Corynebacterium diphtheriae]
MFHADNPTSELLATLAVFAVGFVARPIGGYVFGAYADRVGRKRSLFAAMMITALGSLIIAFTPTYGTVGVLASVILVIARLLQGLAHGGEMGTSVTYLVERARRAGAGCSGRRVGVRGGGHDPGDTRGPGRQHAALPRAGGVLGLA